MRVEPSSSSPTIAVTKMTCPDCGHYWTGTEPNRLGCLPPVIYRSIRCTACRKKGPDGDPR